MRRHLRPWLNDAALVRLGGSYEGIIVSVLEEAIRNRFTGQRQIEPVIVFDDGYRCVQNLTMRQSLINLFGHETTSWPGRRVRIIRKRKESINRATAKCERRG